MTPRGWSLLCVLALGGCGRELPASPEARPVELVVTRGDLEEQILMTGELDAVSSESLVAPQTRFWEISIRWMEEAGTRVKAGQSVLEFDNAQLASQLEEKKLAALQAENALSRQKAEDAIATADKEFAVERQAIVLEKAKLAAAIAPDLVARRDYQERQLALERAKIEHEKAEDELAAHLKSIALAAKVKRIELESARREIQTAEVELDALVLEAPRDGILVAAINPREGRKFKVGDNAWPGVPILKLPDLSVMEVKASLSDVDDGRVVAGMKASCVVDAYSELIFAGTVKEVSPVAREPSSGSLRRSFEVEIALDETDPERMRPGMSVKVVVHGRKAEGVLIAPRAGLDLTADPPRARRVGGDVEVRLGFCTPQACVVEDGLEEGARLRHGGGR